MWNSASGRSAPVVPSPSRLWPLAKPAASAPRAVASESARSFDLGFRGIGNPPFRNSCLLGAKPSSEPSKEPASACGLVETADTPDAPGQSVRPSYDVRAAGGAHG